MSKRLILTMGNTEHGAAVKVYHDSEYSEYVGRLYVNGKLYEPADYFTSDREDALITAQSMVTRCDAITLAEYHAATAFDQYAEYGGYQEAIYTFWQNIRDTLREYGWLEYENVALAAFDARIDTLRQSLFA